MQVPLSCRFRLRFPGFATECDDSFQENRRWRAPSVSVKQMIAMEKAHFLRFAFTSWATVMGE